LNETLPLASFGWLFQHCGFIFPDMSASHLPESGAGSPNAGTRGIVVFIIRRDARCGECGRELFKGNFLRLEKDKPLCLDCADLGYLEFLPRGDAAITRRASKYSPLWAVVVQWSHTRKRYERQGILVAPEAIERAEQESLADADQRARQRERAALKREAEDQEYIFCRCGAVETPVSGLSIPGSRADRASCLSEVLRAGGPFGGGQGV